jgi:hypothetical protein
MILMKILILFLGTILAFSVLLSNQSFAVDFRDSNGYTPNWAKSLGPYQALNKCSTIINEITKDGNWCFEWTAYVVDQGYENFPESATGKQSTSIQSPILVGSNSEKDQLISKISDVLKEANLVIGDELVDKDNTNWYRYTIFDSKGNEMGLLDVYADHKIRKVEALMTFASNEASLKIAILTLFVIEEQIIPTEKWESEIGKNFLLWIGDSMGKGLEEDSITIDNKKVSYNSVIREDFPVGVLSFTVDYDTNIKSAASTITTGSEKPLQEPKSVQITKEEAPRFDDLEESTPAWAIGLGIFVVFGIPAIIIGLIIWKIKKGRSARKLATDWKGI